MIENIYLWIVIVGGFTSFFAAMGIGANDVANAFATSVGSKALSMKGAVVIATIFEFAGALLMGSHVTETIRKDIANYECFEDNPSILMYGCMYVLLSVGAWLFIASKYEMPVSTTHSCVGGMIGMSLALGGSGCVQWYTIKDDFPYVGGVGGILLSWLFSPILSLLLAMIIYAITRAVVLRHKNSFTRSFYSFPVFVGLTLMLNTFFIIYKGGKGLGWDDIEAWVAAIIAVGIGLVSAAIMIPIMPRLKKRILDKFTKKTKDIELQQIENQDGNQDENQDENQENNQVKISESSNSLNSLDSTNSKKSLFNYNMDKDIVEDELVNNIHNDAEKFDEKTEESFKFLQVFTAICDSFSHGANDVANSIGPFAAIFSIWTTGVVAEDSELGNNMYWILAIGGVGISLGLVLYGYNIIRAIGVKMCKITPSRGFSIELSSATIIILGSRLGIPLSTTHCQVGATMGIGLLEKNKSKSKCKCAGINVKVMLKTMLGWILTLLIVGGFTALLVAQGVYSPNNIVTSCNTTNLLTNLTNVSL